MTYGNKVLVVLTLLSFLSGTHIDASSEQSLSRFERVAE